MARSVRAGGVECEGESYFDTLTLKLGEKAEGFLRAASDKGYNLRLLTDGRIGIAFDETTTDQDVDNLLGCLGCDPGSTEKGPEGIPEALVRRSSYLGNEVFSLYHSETEMMRYLRRLEGKDLALNESMISLGSCTMKLNGTTEMIPVTWHEVSKIHPFVPKNQVSGY